MARINMLTTNVPLPEFNSNATAKLDVVKSEKNTPSEKKTPPTTTSNTTSSGTTTTTTTKHKFVWVFTNGIYSKWQI